MPRPSCGRYTRIPEGACPIFLSDNSSCARQSHRNDVSTSPVRHCECTRTSGAVLPFKFPRTSATASSCGPRPLNPKMVKRPWRVGSSACATICTVRELFFNRLPLCDLRPSETDSITGSHNRHRLPSAQVVGQLPIIRPNQELTRVRQSRVSELLVTSRQTSLRRGRMLSAHE